MSLDEHELRGDDEELEARTGSRTPYTMVGDWILMANVSAQAKLLYALLAAHVNVASGDRKVWPSLETLAQWIGLKQARSVSKYIDELVQLGAVRKVQQKTAQGMRTRNIYYVEGEPPAGLKTSIKFGDFYAQRNAARSSKPAGGDVVRSSARRADQGEPVSPGGDVVRPSAPRTAPERPDVVRPSAPEQDQSREQNQGGERARDDAKSTSTSDSNNPPPPSSAERGNLDEPWTWVCREHWPLRQADPEANVPNCTRCGQAREWCQGRFEAREQARAAAERARVEACGWHDPEGWVIDPATRLPFEPLIRCDHTRSPDAIITARLTAEVPTVEASSVEARANARRIANCKAPRPRPKRVLGQRRAQTLVPDSEEAGERSADSEAAVSA